MGAGGDLARDGIIRIERERLGPLHRRRHGLGIREYEAGHAIGQRRLADALRAADQPGMRNAPAAIGFEQGHLGIAMAEPGGGFTRMRRRNALLDLARAHADRTTLSASALKKRSRKVAHTLAATAAGSASA